VIDRVRVVRAASVSTETHAPRLPEQVFDYKLIFPTTQQKSCRRARGGATHLIKIRDRLLLLGAGQGPAHDPTLA
jgi:hypothetical protein